MLLFVAPNLPSQFQRNLHTLFLRVPGRGTQGNFRGNFVARSLGNGFYIYLLCSQEFSCLKFNQRIP
jgi:hypothetical protein